MASSPFRDFLSLGAGVTPAEGSVKPTAGFTYKSYCINFLLLRRTYRALREALRAGHNRCFAMNYDVIIVGAGHAGIEAALAAARMGASTLMLTLNLDHIGQMSCNPAIGGIGKGHLVREIDALGGEMGLAIDETGIQFRFLNTRKGPAVRARRAQADKAAYRARSKRVLERTANLQVRQASVERLIVEDGAVRGVESQIGEVFEAPTVILTTGTFLKGLVHVGLKNYSAGRAGDFAAMGLSEHLAQLGFRIGRLKTGTCPRLDARTIDYSALEIQPGDEPPPPFSFRTERIAQAQLPCHLTFTNARTHEMIRGGIDRSPMYSGVIQSRGPRYCPSVEDKVMRFRDKDAPSDFSRARGPRHRRGLSQRPLDQPAARRADRDGAFDRGARAGRDHAARLRDRVRLFGPDAVDLVARDQAGARAVLRRPDQRHHRL